jgi:hypothetical protein
VNATEKLYEMDGVVGALTLDKRQAKILSLILSDQVAFMAEDAVLEVTGVEREALTDVKRRIDELCGFEDIIQPKATLDPQTVCANCGQTLVQHFPTLPPGCEGFMRA